MIIVNEAVVARIHDRMIELYGGLPGMPYPERLPAIIGRVEQTAYYTDPKPDDYQMAALYMTAIARGHIFNDANKRTALAVALFYLARREIFLSNTDEDQAELVAQTVRVATGELDVDSLADWLRNFPTMY